MRVVITDCDHGFFDPEEQVALERGVELAVAGGAPDRPRAMELAAHSDAILCQYLRVDAELLDALPSCRVVGRYGVGLDNVDLPAARERGVEVVNVPDFCVSEVADHTLALALAATRRVALLDREWRRDPERFAERWSERFEHLAGVERASQQRFGIVGLGRIGRAVSSRAGAFGFEVRSCDPFSDSGEVARLELDELLATSDVVSLHLPLGPETEAMLDASKLALMKESAVLVNTARGALIDESALVRALEAGRPGWAALDVFADEPLPADHGLFSLPNVVLTPHVAFYSRTSVIDLKRRALASVVDALAREPRRR